jgi:hypothetical protein
MAMQLEPDQIVATSDQLCRRIKERFPSAGLNKCASELLAISRQAKVRAAAIDAPMTGLRVVSALGIGGIVVLFLWTIFQVRLDDKEMHSGELIQILEAGSNAAVLVGAIVLFLVTLETRVKRRRALKAIHELRALAHIVDMHQLTKDPERTFRKGSDTASSPKRVMTNFELNRYLDYCSEMLSLSGKIAALYVQNFEDSSAVGAVNDLEDLTSGLSRKIWQKIMILHSSKNDGAE